MSSITWLPRGQFIEKRQMWFFIPLASSEDDECVSHGLLKLINQVFYNCLYEHMDLNIVGRFQTIAIIILIEVWMVLPLASGRPPLSHKKWDFSTQSWSSSIASLPVLNEVGLFFHLSPTSRLGMHSVVILVVAAQSLWHVALAHWL